MAGGGAQVLYQDDAVIVLDKPAGVAVSRGRAGLPSVEDWLEGLRQGKRHLPQPAHRLDAETAGCLALGRTRPAMAALGALFADRAVEKTYWAVVVGGPAEDAGVVEAPLLKVSSKAAGWRMVVDPKGQPALTRWRVLGRGDGLAWLELAPETGRTHQLRVHCAARGWPILGDAMYGAAAEGGLHLLARRLAFTLGVRVAVEASVPVAMQAALRRCGW
ncbi:RluA family pseudouridine synthase [Plastoroseomonas arctica]|uniref:RNA pseudouridine synthase n=1 Tax=Plastoroseomonas arctica TaxID=1509237 RepID=A0AAF1JWY0_9PROT|nr:RNA pseudouridine synthase [Plastoroseomonas arctica]MBR0654248.1 RNA pseudouridine synthase [Plastoroseomonas arctica]